MHSSVLFVVAGATLAICQWRDRRRLRVEFERLGHRVERMRWLVFGSSHASLQHRRTFAYEVTSEGPDGRRWRTHVVCPVFADVEPIWREQREPASPLARSVPAASQPRDAARHSRVIGTREPAVGVAGPDADGAGGGGDRSARSAFWFAAIGAAAIFAVAGIPYWLLPYPRLELPTSLLGPGLAVAVLAAAVLQFHFPRRRLVAFTATAGAIVAVVLLRILLDVARDPTTHNLLPLELGIAAMVGGAAAGAGMLLGRLVRALRGA